jgi:phage-related protein (TIGR01555 family)
MLKPAFNFAGMSLSQLAQPYVDNWLRTRQSVSDLIANFSITALATAMDQVLQDGDDGADVFARAKLFTLTRDNQNLMLLDKEREELVQLNTPLSGLHELQAQSQEHMCSVSRIPAIVLTGISPSGLNATSDGEIRVFNDWIAAGQMAYWYELIEIISRVAQLSLFGEIDPNIKVTFEPLYQMTEKELAEIREINSRIDTAYMDHGVLDADEVRQRLADDPDSGYNALDMTKQIEPPAADPGGVNIPGIVGDDPPPPGGELDESDNVK